MATIVPPRTFLSLPTEIRLHIASFALEQSPEAGLVRQYKRGRPNPSVERRYRLFPDENYRAASNLNILLVCRQFRNDFTRLAWANTTFLMSDSELECMPRWHVELIRRLRKLVGAIPFSVLKAWETRPFNNEAGKLDQLTLTRCDGILDEDVAAAKLFRRLTNVKVIKFLLTDKRHWDNPSHYNHLARALLVEDRKQRYEAADAPNLGNTWWEWTCDGDERSFTYTFTAVAPLPIMDEQDYTMLMKPKVDAACNAPFYLKRDQSSPDPYLRRCRFPISPWETDETAKRRRI